MKAQRIRAALVDLGLALCWVAVVGAVAAGLWFLGVGATIPPLQLNVILGGAVVLPVLAVLALTEGGRYGASPGKQWLGLRVQRVDGADLGRGRALLRNLLKLGLPWLLGHAAVVSLATAQPPLGVDVWILAAIAVVVPVGYLVAALAGEGRTPYDVVAASRVVAPARGRRVASG